MSPHVSALVRPAGPASEGRALAIVTGASSGIGAEFARQLASEGLDLLIIARRTDRLALLASDIETSFGVRCHSMTLDLADYDAADRVHREALRIGLPVKWLVNNAGYGLIGPMDGFSPEEHRRFVRVLATTPVETTLKLLPELRRAAPAHIVNVASLAAFLPGIPGAGLYPGTKAFLLRFSETLAAEERGAGVSVTASCPGLTDTEIFDHQEGGRDAAFRTMRPMSAEQVVREAIEAARQGKISIVHGQANRAVAWLFRHLPPRVSRWLVGKAYAVK